MSKSLHLTVQIQEKRKTKMSSAIVFASLKEDYFLRALRGVCMCVRDHVCV
jgi:hypothetical protein